MDRLIQGITAPFEAFKSSVDNLFSPLENTVKGITAIMTFLNNLKNFLGELFADLFVPDPEFIEQRFSQFLTNIPFIDNFLEVAGFITDQILILDGGVVPKLTFTLSKTEGQYTFEDCEVSIDFSWYAPYKENMDKILAAVIWFGFLRRMYFKLPDIINGAGAVTDVIEDSRNFEPREKRRRRRGG